MTVTSIDAARPPSVLGELVVDQVRPVAAALRARLKDGNWPGPQEIGAVGGGLSYRQVWALALLAIDCADDQKFEQACREPRTAAEIAEDYSWLRDAGFIPAVAAKRCGIRSQQRTSEYETEYQELRQARRKGCAA